MNNETIYPPSVEEKLQMIVEFGKQLEYETPLHDNCVREVFGELFLQAWLSGDENLEISTEEVMDLFDKAAAMSMLDDYLSDGYIDTIEVDGEEMIYVTQKGREFYDDFSKSNNQNSTHNGNSSSGEN
jgi:hypothetical protein